MDVREKLVKLLDRFVDDDWYSSEEIADNLIAHGVTVQEWIPVTERLPESYENVLVSRKNIDGHGCYKAIEHIQLWHDGSKMWSGDATTWKNTVTHWMPLPEMPKEE